MSFVKPKTPKVEAVEPEQVNEAAVDATARERERRRQGYAASVLTSERGVQQQSIQTATQALLGR